MQKINWINGQAGGTPLSAENLNLMQNYIEQAIEEVTDFTSQVTFNETVVADTTRFVKKGNVVHVVYQGEAKTHSASTVLAVLPEEYRPTVANSWTPFVINGLAYGAISINKNGNITIGFISSTSANGRIYANFTYQLN